jgi:hypothetical protein
VSVVRLGLRLERAFGHDASAYVMVQGCAA